jgi:hypothetical protein
MPCMWIGFQGAQSLGTRHGSLLEGGGIPTFPFFPVWGEEKAFSDDP